MDVAVNALYYWAIKRIPNGEKLKIVFESRNGDEWTIRNYNLIQSAEAFQKNKWMATFSKKFKEVVVSIGFANKMVQAVGLEIADIISYTCNVNFIQKTSDKKDLRKIISFRGLNKILNEKHYHVLNGRAIARHIPFLDKRAKRIAGYYNYIERQNQRDSLSPT